MAGARGARRARSGLDRRRPCLRTLAGGIAGDRTARCAGMARAGDRDGKLAGDRAGAGASRARANRQRDAAQKRRTAARSDANGNRRAVAASQPSKPPNKRRRPSAGDQSPNRSSRSFTHPTIPGPTPSRRTSRTPNRRAAAGGRFSGKGGVAALAACNFGGVYALWRMNYIACSSRRARRKA